MRQLVGKRLDDAFLCAVLQPIDDAAVLVASGDVNLSEFRIEFESVERVNVRLHFGAIAYRDVGIVHYRLLELFQNARPVRTIAPVISTMRATRRWPFRSQYAAKQTFHQSRR